MAKKIAIVADWLTNMGGAEHTVLSLHRAFPDAPIYTSVYEYDKMPGFEKLDVRTTFLQKLPGFIRRKHQLYAPLRALAFRKLDLTDYDIIISSSSAEAKAVHKRPDALHICYCHTPIRYYWSHYNEYLQNPGFGWLDPVVRLLMPPFVWWMRKLDLASVKGVDYFIANSEEVATRIKTYYHREATVIYPPVEIERLRPKKPVKKEDYYLIVGRQIPYKRVDLAISACNELFKHLIVIGKGPEHKKLIEMAGPTIEFKTKVDDQEIAEYFQKAKGYIFPQLDDFGIVAVEALSAGTPVIAYGQGGAKSSITPGKTGLLFAKQTTESLVQAITKFEKMHFESQNIIADAERFSEQRFITAIQKFIKGTG